MQIVILDNHTLRLTQVFEPQEVAIEKRFRVMDPKAFHARSMKSGHWDGYYRFYNKKNQTINRGYLKDLVQLCVEKDFPFEIVDKRDKAKYPVPAPGSFDKYLVDAEIKGKRISAHDHQMRCWESVCKASQHAMFEVGTHFHPTGAGKSLMMAGIVKLIRCPTVIITEQSIVLNQITECLKMFNVVHHDDIGEFYSGKMPDGNLVCVGSIAALQDPVKPILGKMKIKMQTLNKDFDAMLSKNKEKLAGIMSFNGMLAYQRSRVIDKIKSLWGSKKDNIKKRLADIVPKHSDWKKVEADVYENVEYWFENDSKKLEGMIGKDLAKEWNDTKVVSKIYDKSLFNGLELWNTYERDKYFQSALKAYQTRIIKARELQDMVSDCELLLVDEMDNAASANYDKLFGKWFKGRYIHGFSGTPYDPDKPVEEMKLRGRFGPVVSKSLRKELEGINQIQPVKYYMIQFGDDDPKDKTAFDVAERDIIIDNVEFHNQINKMISNWPNERHLIIVDTSNVEDIGKALEELIPNSSFLYGKVAHKKRRDVIKSYENGELNTLIVSKVGKRGMDLGGGTDNMYLIGGGKNRSNFDQIIGRAVRKNSRGWARVFDFYFTGNHYLLDHSRKRLRFITEMGYEAKIIFGKTVVDADHFVSKRYRIPKK